MASLAVRSHLSTVPIPWLGCLPVLFLTVSLAYSQCIQVQNVSGSISGEPPDSGRMMIYHAALHRMLVYDDLISAPSHVFAAYDGRGWTDLPLPPFPARSSSAWIYDSARNVGLLFGGVGKNAPELWSYDGAWHQLNWVGTSPPAISGGPWGTFDPIRGRAIFIFAAGNEGFEVWETWEWTGSGWERGPNLGPFAPDLTFVFDPSRNIGFIAGEDANACNEAVWFYRPGPTAAQSVWEQQIVTGVPYQGRIGTTLAYDSYRHRIFRCCGRWNHACDNGDTTGYVGEIDIWDFASSTWNRTTDYNLPYEYRRIASFVAFDSDRDKLVVASGIRNDLVNGSLQATHYHDTWEMSSDEPGLSSSSQGTSVHCEGETAVFALSAVGANLTYEWFHNAVLIPNANASVLVLNGLTTADSGNYVGRVKNDCGYADTPITRLQVKGPITIHRSALFPDCSLTCVGSDVSIFPPNPLDLSLNMHLQKWSPGWVDVRVSTPSAPTNFVFHNVQTNFTGNYRFYIDGSPCDPYVDSEHWIQIGFDISKQPVSLSNVRPCSYPTFTVGWLGACGIPQFHWFKDNFQFLSEDDGHFSGVHTDTLRIEGARYEDEGSYGCMLVDTNRCNYTNFSQLATLRLVPSQWVLRSASGPSARYGHAMVYDSARGVTMLFGGEKLSDDHSRYDNFGDVWEWNGANWRQRTTSSATSGWAKATNTGYWYPAYDVPLPRGHHALAYDTKRARVVLFGGRSIPPDGVDAFLFLADTWEWDGLRWQLRATNGPVARIGHSMAYDAARGVTVLFGGFTDGQGYSDLVWEWDGNSWRSNAPSSGPASGDLGSMAYDAWRHKIVYGPTSDGFVANHFWTWNGSAWSFEGTGFGDVTPSPPYGAMVFDSYRVRPLYIGGEQNRFGASLTASFFESGSAALRAQWSLQPDMASTSSFVTNDFIDPAIVIQIRQRTDPLSDFIWNQLSDATRQTLTNGSSTIDNQIIALSSDFNRIIGGGPIIYDPQRFAGVTLSAETLAFQRINPWWAPDPNLIRFNRLLLEDYYPTTIARSPSMPPGRLRHAMAYDSRRHATVVFGGLYDPVYPLQLVGNETWELLAFDMPIIIEQPPSQYGKPGESIAFHVDARAPAGDLLTYQWYFGQRVLGDDAHVNGSNKDTLTLLNVTPADAGQYWVRVSDNCGFTDSFPAILTLDPKLQVFSVANALKLIWSDPNVVLEQSDASIGPWTAVPGATSPFDISLTGPGKFFRLRQTGP